MGARTQLRYPDTKAVTYTLDALGRIQTVLDWASQTTSYTYNAAGQVATTTLPSGLRTVYGYDAAERLQTLTHSTSIQILGAYTYTVDATGTRTQVVERLQVPDQPVTGSSAQPGFGSVNSGIVATNGSRFRLSGATGGAAHAWMARWLASTSTTTGTVTTTTTITYGYDSLYRLTDATYSDGTLFGYQYDSVGNVLTKTQTLLGIPDTLTYTYDNANRQMSADGLTQTYDDNGNLLNDGTTAYTWDGANRMTASGSTTYTYNGQNDRVGVGGVIHRLDLNTGLTQVLADSTNTYLYGAGRLGEQQGATWQYHLADGLGSVRQLANASGAVSEAKNYEPYGKGLSSAGSTSSAYGFTGEQQNGKLVYLRSRFYHSDAMRFASRDSWEGQVRDPMSLNRWLYVSGQVQNITDPSGKTPTGCFGTKLGYAIRRCLETVSFSQRHTRSYSSSAPGIKSAASTGKLLPCSQETANLLYNTFNVLKESEIFDEVNTYVLVAAMMSREMAGYLDGTSKVEQAGRELLLEVFSREFYSACPNGLTDCSVSHAGTLSWGLQRFLAYSESFKKLGSSYRAALLNEPGGLVADRKTLIDRFLKAIALVQRVVTPSNPDWRTGKLDTRPSDYGNLVVGNPTWLINWVNEGPVAPGPIFDDNHTLVFSSVAGGGTTSFYMLTPPQKTELCGQKSCVNLAVSDPRPTWMNESYSVEREKE